MLTRIYRPTGALSSVFRASQQVRQFANKNDANDHLDPALIEKYKNDFEESLDARQKAFYRADRLALLDNKREIFTEENNWWNKLKSMNEDELELMPYGFIKKYGTFMLKIKENQQQAHLESNQAFKGRWDSIKRLDKLMTDTEKDELEEFKRDNNLHSKNTYDEYVQTDYMKREPRVDLRKENFNFE